MNTKNLIAAVATVLVTSFGANAAMAQEATIETPVVKSTSVTTRQAVHAEAVQAVAQGRILFGEVSRVLPALKADAAPVTRAQVATEAREAVRLGLAQYGEASIRML